MSSESTSNALVASGSNHTTFTQQGSLDWVALGRTQYSASIAVLSRLAKAGVDTLTVAFGQAMCLKLPIGAHGEKALAESMKTLAAKSFAGDVLWFGVGVRHILRDLVQTAQGCSLVALCAALTEGHSTSVAALVLYELAGKCGDPDDLAPSFEQWESLIRVASPVFNSTTFGVRIHQIARFGMQDSHRPDFYPENCHPSDLANTLLLIGQIVHGTLQSISIQGGCGLSWIAVWADFVLGLRVLVRDKDGKIVFANHDIESTVSQVTIDFHVGENHRGIILAESSQIIRSGAEFIQQSLSTRRTEHLFGGGRLEWESMLSHVFGDAFSALVGQPNVEPLPGEAPDRSAIRTSTEHIFRQQLALASILIVNLSITTVHHGSARSYLLRMCETLPELRHCGYDAIAEVECLTALFNFEDTTSLIDSSAQSPILQRLADLYRETYVRLENNCRCASHHKSTSKPRMGYCLSRLSSTIIYMSFLFDHLILETSLRPTFYGLRRLYYQNISTDTTTAAATVTTLTRSSKDGIVSAAETLFAVFSNTGLDQEFFTDIAQSDGKMYWYIEVLESLTDDIGKASKIHLGSGQI